MSEQLKIYLKVFFGTWIICCLVVAYLNYQIDPFAIYHPPESLRNGWLAGDQNYLHTTFVRLHKAQLLSLNRREGKASSEILLLGNSRMMQGIDPGDAVFEGKAFNAGLSGATTYELYRYLQHAESLHPIRTVILGLDYIMFNPTRKTRLDFKEERLAVNEKGEANHWYSMSDLGETLFSFDTLLKSKVVASKMKAVNEEGHADPEAVKSFEKSVQQEFYEYREFKGKGIEEGGGYLHYQNILNFCEQNHIELLIFISPQHCYNVEVASELNQEENVENWKRELVQMNDAVEKNQGEKRIQRFVDYSGYNSITTESVEGKLSGMKNYFESSHYRPSVGGVIIRDLLTGNRREAFGKELNGTNISKMIQVMREEKDHYRSMHPEMIERVKEWGGAVKKK